MIKVSIMCWLNEMHLAANKRVDYLINDHQRDGHRAICFAAGQFSWLQATRIMQIAVVP